MELPGVIVERIRHPAPPGGGGDPFRAAVPAPVPDTLHVLRYWSSRARQGSPWWLLGTLLTAWPAFFVWRNGEPLFWVGVLLVAPIWFLLPAIGSVSLRSPARLELTGHDVRIQTAPWRRWQRFTIRGARLAVRPAHDGDGFALLAVSDDGAIELMRFDQRSPAEALAFVLGKELGIVEPVDTRRLDEAPERRAAPLGPLGPLVDALAPDRH